MRRAGGGIVDADCLISPDLVSHSYMRFSQKLDTIRRGEIAAEAQLPAIRAALTSGTDKEQPVCQGPFAVRQGSRGAD